MDKEIAKLEAVQSAQDAAEAEAAQKAELEEVLKNLIGGWHERSRNHGQAQITEFSKKSASKRSALEYRLLAFISVLVF